MMLQDYDCEIEHRIGSKMRHVDAFIRMHYLILEDSLIHRLREAHQQDEWIRAICKVLEKDEYEDFFVKNHIL